MTMEGRGIEGRGLGDDHADLLGGDLEDLSYEELVDRLELLTERLSSGEVGIEQAARLYERAGEVHRAAAERLEQIRRRLGALEAEADGST